MKVFSINGRDYRLPDSQNSFQQRLYVHLINWKWNHITTDVGFYSHAGKLIPYDAFLPERLIADLPCIYPPVVPALKIHRRRNPFRLHTHFHHVASSQAANVNLFLPVLHHPRGNEVFAALKPDFAELATDQLDHGYCLEFWGGNLGLTAPRKGPLGDKSARGGTDADLAIAYRDHSGTLCLWLIEHKLAEQEFTPCGGYKSKDRKNHVSCICDRSFTEIIADKDVCYHHSVLHRGYWQITESNRDLFVNTCEHKTCPFQGGMNQLWRNQLLALAMEQSDTQPYQHASFSVVKHPANSFLDDSLKSFQLLLGGSSSFTVFTSEDLLRAAEKLNDEELSRWTAWYRDVYMLNAENTQPVPAIGGAYV